MPACSRDRVLVLVHPGSACGSANYHLGRQVASACRAEMTSLLDSWCGGVIVLDGDLSDELPDYPIFRAAIENALHRARCRGCASIRAIAQDPDQVRVVGDLVENLAMIDAEFVVTGAWYDPTDESGCVNSVVCELKRRDLKTEVAQAVVAHAYEDGDASGGMTRLATPPRFG